MTSPLPGFDASADLVAEQRMREDDPTPRAVVRAILAAVPPGVFDFDARPTTVLDVGAGYGGWSSELRRLTSTAAGPAPVITGVEIDARKREHLRKWCDHELIGDWREMITGRHYDVAIGNPHFSALTHEDVEDCMPAVLLRHAPAVLLLHTQQAFVRGAAGRALWRAYPPARQWIVPGAVRFRVGINPASGKRYGTDTRCYAASLWLRGHDGPTSVELLPELDARQRAWTVPPGTEDPAEQYPPAPAWPR